MPGYGFAKASKGQIKEWTKLSDLYLKNKKKFKKSFFAYRFKKKNYAY